MSQAIAVQPAHEILRAHALGTMIHRYQGLCPDHIDGSESRDPECEVCAAIDSHDEQQRLLQLARLIIGSTEYDPTSLTGRLAAEFLQCVQS